MPPHLLELLLQMADPLADQAAAGLQLRLAGAARADARPSRSRWLHWPAGGPGPRRLRRSGLAQDRQEPVVHDGDSKPYEGSQPINFVRRVEVHGVGLAEEHRLGEMGEREHVLVQK